MLACPGRENLDPECLGAAEAAAADMTCGEGCGRTGPFAHAVREGVDR